MPAGPTMIMVILTVFCTCRLLCTLHQVGLILFQTDRVESNRTLKVGKIEVVRYEVTFTHNEMEYQGCSSGKEKEFAFLQANKKDVDKVTNQKYTMTTTRKGRLLRDGKPYDPPEKKSPKVPSPRRMVSVPVYDIGDKPLGKLHVEYHMTQTLLDWGIQLIRPEWPERDLGTVDEKNEAPDGENGNTEEEKVST